MLEQSMYYESRFEQQINSTYGRVVWSGDSSGSLSEPGNLTNSNYGGSGHMVCLFDHVENTNRHVQGVIY